MYDSKPAASLTAGLLARKGHARPAIRPQQVAADYDLGMSAPAPTPNRARARLVISERETLPIPPADSSPVAAVQAEIAERLAAAAVVDEVAPVAVTAPVVADEPVAVAEPVAAAASAPAAIAAEVAPRPRAERGSKPKSAFTLRLDGERHLKLRLLSAHKHKSSQALLIEALDHYLAASAADLPAANTCVCRAIAQD